jgi:hypothetical protein
MGTLVHGGGIHGDTGLLLNLPEALPPTLCPWWPCRGQGTATGPSPETQDSRREVPVLLGPASSSGYLGQCHWTGRGGFGFISYLISTSQTLLWPDTVLSM